MEFFVGLDVSLDDTHFCVIDEDGRIEAIPAKQHGNLLCKSRLQPSRLVRH